MCTSDPTSTQHSNSDYLQGLEYTGFVTVMRRNPDVFEPLLVYSENEVNADVIISIAVFKFSEEATHVPRHDKNVKAWFHDFVRDCDGSRR